MLEYCAVVVEEGVWFKKTGDTNTEEKWGGVSVKSSNPHRLGRQLKLNKVVVILGESRLTEGKGLLTTRGK